MTSKLSIYYCLRKIFVSRFIQNLVKEHDLEEDITVFKADVRDFLRKTGKTYDIIFADPPFHLGFHEELIAQIFDKNLLRPDGYLIIEHGKQDDFSQEAHFDICRNFGNVYFSFFKPTVWNAVYSQEVLTPLPKDTKL